MHTCQHGIDTDQFICEDCEKALAQYRALTAVGAHTKETNDRAIALLLAQQENDRIFGSRFR